MIRFTTFLAVFAWIALPAVALGQDPAAEALSQMEPHVFTETVIQLHGEAPFEVILANTGT